MPSTAEVPGQRSPPRPGPSTHLGICSSAHPRTALPAGTCLVRRLLPEPAVSPVKLYSAPEVQPHPTRPVKLYSAPESPATPYTPCEALLCT
eukprot:359139-Chlamydomonas_euryale.AAC.18